MATEITMPQLSDTMDKGTIVTWFKKEGDTVSRGDALAEVATDKANLEIESFHEGVLLQVRAQAGTVVKVGEVIAVLGEAGEKPAERPSVESTPAPAAPEGGAAEGPAAPAAAQAAAPAETGAGERVKISPLAKNLARAHGVDPSAITPTGEGGRIVKRDIEKHVGAAIGPDQVEQAITGRPAAGEPQAPAPQATAAGPDAAAPLKAPPAAAPAAGAQPLSRMREAIAVNMVASKTTIPHFYMTAKAEVDELLDIRETLKSHPAYEGITINHLVIRAAALALKAFPRINSAFRDNQLIQHSAINIGIITAVEDGLLVPVLRNAGELSLVDIVTEARGLIQRARAGRPKAEDLSGGTFSISNVGPYEVESFSAIVFPGQAGVLAVGGVQEEPVAKEGNIYPARVVRFTLSADHRVIDGVIAAEFLTQLKRLIETPVLLVA